MKENNIKKIYIIAKYTFFELYKSKVLTNTIFLGLALILVCYVASEFTYGVPEKIALDFGLGTLSLSAVGIAIFMGAGLLSTELESRTAYMVLSRSFNRYIYLLGKILGMAAILFLNVLILGLLTLSIYFWLGGEFSGLIAWSVFFCYLESLIVLQIVVFFSLITNVTMSVIYTLMVYIVGHAMEDALGLNYVEQNPIIAWAIKVFSALLPDFSKMNVKNYVIYQQNISGDYLINVAGFAVGYLLILMVICSLILEFKDLE